MKPMRELSIPSITGKTTTERKQAEEALRESEERFHAAFNRGAIAMAIAALDGRFLQVNPALCDMLGFSESELLARTFFDITHPDDLDINRTGVQQMVNGETSSFRMEKRYLHQDGHPVWVDMCSVVVCDAEGHPSYYVTHLVDITERKRTEEAMRAREATLRGILDATQESIWLFSADGHFLLGNTTALQRIGVPETEILAQHLHDILPPALAEARLARLQQVIDSQQPVEFEDERAGIQFRHSFYPVLDAEGRMNAIASFSRDITARKKTEAALRESEARFRTIAETLPVLISLTRTEDAAIVFTNAAYNEAFGYRKEDIIGRKGPDVYYDPVEREKMLAIVNEQGCVDNYQLKAKKSDGTPIWLLSAVRPILYGGQPAILGASIDITEYKRAEVALWDVTQRLTYHVDNSPLAVIEWGPDMRLIRWSREAERIFGWAAEEVLGKHMEDFRWIYQEDEAQVAEVSDELQTGADPQRFSANRNYHKDGSVVYCEWYNSSLLDEADNLRSILSLVLDVTERKRAEEALQASLREKEVLLKEIHHRVKNNMQVISSLVSLQAETIDNPALSGLFNDLRDQVRSMALVHEKLYQSDSLASVDFAEYTNSLLNYLWRAYGDTVKNVRLTLNIQPVSLPVDKAVPGGLILNELVTNALKHAFRDRTDGEVTVTLHAGPDNRIRLHVSDNGIGLPANLDWQKSPSLGLRLVQMLAGQLRGKLEVERDGGTTVTLTFIGEELGASPDYA